MCFSGPSVLEEEEADGTSACVSAVGFHRWELRTRSLFKGDGSAASFVLFQRHRPGSSDASEGSCLHPSIFPLSGRKVTKVPAVTQGSGEDVGRQQNVLRA